jgi:lipopolysaccharide transport system permease protein
MTLRGGDARAAATGLVVIRPHHGWVSLNLRELWSYRELLYFMVWRDLKVRYRQTLFGALWAVIQPFMLMLAFTLYLGRIGGLAPNGVPYPLFVFAGLVPWTLFSQGLVGASGSLVGASNLIQKVYFPRLLLPIAAMASYLLDFVIAIAVLFLMMFYFGFPLSLSVIWVVPLTLLLVAIALAFGIWLSALNVSYRDVRHALPFLIQFWFFASPVAYSGNLIPSEWRAIYELNPMTGVLEGLRWALLEPASPPPLGPILASVVVMLAVLAVGLGYFRRVEQTFADVI